MTKGDSRRATRLLLVDAHRFLTSCTQVGRSSPFDHPPVAGFPSDRRMRVLAITAFAVWTLSYSRISSADLDTAMHSDETDKPLHMDEHRG